MSVNEALNELIERKITEYSSSEDPTKQEGGTLNIGSAIQLNFAPSTNLQNTELTMEAQIIQKFQEVDQSLDKCEDVVGHWEPQNKFLCLYRKIEELGEQVDELDTRTMDRVGNRAKELNRDLDEVLRQLQ